MSMLKRQTREHQIAMTNRAPIPPSYYVTLKSITPILHVFIADDFANKQFVDFTIEFPGNREPIRCHQVVLACYSPVLKTMLLNRDKFEEGANKTWKITNDDEEMLHVDSIIQMITFFYKRRVKVCKSQVFDLLETAHMYQVKELYSLCKTNLLDQKHGVTKAVDDRYTFGLDLFERSNVLSDKKLSQHYLLFIVQNFNEVVKKDAFCQLKLRHVLEILSHDELTVESEEDVYRAAIKWLEFNPKTNSNEPALLQDNSQAQQQQQQQQVPDTSNSNPSDDTDVIVIDDNDNDQDVNAAAANATNNVQQDDSREHVQTNIVSNAESTSVVVASSQVHNPRKKHYGELMNCVRWCNLRNSEFLEQLLHQNQGGSGSTTAALEPLLLQKIAEGAVLNFRDNTQAPSVRGSKSGYIDLKISKQLTYRLQQVLHVRNQCNYGLRVHSLTIGVPPRQTLPKYARVFRKDNSEVPCTVNSPQRTNHVVVTLTSLKIAANAEEELCIDFTSPNNGAEQVNNNLMANKMKNNDTGYMSYNNGKRVFQVRLINCTVIGIDISTK